MDFLKKHRNRKKLAYRLPSYSPASIVFRFVMMSIFGILTIELIVYLMGGRFPGTSVPLKYYLIIIVIFNVAAELEIFADNILERIIPVPKKIKLRIVIQFLLGFIFLAIAHKTAMYFMGPDNLKMENKPAVILGLLIGLFVVMWITYGLTLARLTEKLIDTRKEVDVLKQEKLKMDYNLLQDQLNPHFLFNNLSILKSLIMYDKDTAVKFTDNFTDVYRYVLQSKDKQLVSLKKEGDFIEAYIALHKERLGDGLQVKFSIEKNCIEKMIAPLSMQLLIENAIKHNIAGTESPLLIKIITKDDFLFVENNIQEKASSYSTKTGLSNLVKRYKILTDREVVISQDENIFRVVIPLL